MMISARKPDDGVILINVLVALALGSALVVLMVTSQDNHLDRARRTSAAGQAEALARGAETSVLIALRRDMVEGGQTDHYFEPWAQAQQGLTELTTGQFEVTITDAQSRFDLNALTRGGVVQLQTLNRLLAALELPATLGEQINLQIRRSGPAETLAQFDFLGTGEQERLAPYVTFLPIPGTVNLNTAPPLLLEVMMQNWTAAARLGAIRDRNGFLTPADLTAVGSIGAIGTGFTSDVFDVEIQAEVDEVTVHMQSRLLRHTDRDGQRVLVISRRFGSVSPTGADN